MSLADTLAGGAIGIVGALGTQVYLGRRQERRERRERQLALLLEVHERLTEQFGAVLDFAKAKREAGGRPPGGSVGMMTRLAMLRPRVELLEDERARELADDCLDRMNTFARGMAPGPGDEAFATADEAGPHLKAVREALNALAARIGEVDRASG